MGVIFQWPSLKKEICILNITKYNNPIVIVVLFNPRIVEHRVLCIWNVLELEMRFGQGPGHFEIPMLASLAQHSQPEQTPCSCSCVQPIHNSLGKSPLYCTYLFVEERKKLPVLDSE